MVYKIAKSYGSSDDMDNFRQKRKTRKKSTDATRTPMVVANVDDFVKENPRKSMRDITKDLRTSRRTIGRILEEDMNYKSYMPIEGPLAHRTIGRPIYTPTHRQALTLSTILCDASWRGRWTTGPTTRMWLSIHPSLMPYPIWIESLQLLGPPGESGGRWRWSHWVTCLPFIDISLCIKLYWNILICYIGDFFKKLLSIDIFRTTFYLCSMRPGDQFNSNKRFHKDPVFIYFRCCMHKNIKHIWNSFL